jgi:hypothetical protein
MGLLLAEGKTLKHLKEKPQHKTPYHDLSFCGEEPCSRGYGRKRLLVETHDEHITLIIIIIIISIIIIVTFLVIEHRRNEIDWVRPKYSGKPCTCATLSTTNPTWTDPGPHSNITTFKH